MGCRASRSRYNMYMARLTLSIDDTVLWRARRCADRHGISVSKMVEAHLVALAEPPSFDARDAPITRSLRSLKKANLDDYRKYVAAR